MPYLRDTVIVLKKEQFREQDRRYTMYGREHGLLVAVARGSSRLSSKQAGHLEPFCESDVMIAKGVVFDKLAVAKSHQSSVVSREWKLASYATCGGFADLVMQFVRPGIADERIFDLLGELIAVCAALPQEPTPERARLLLSAAALKLLDLLGFAPQLPSATVYRLPSTVLLSHIRRSPLADVLRVTASVDVLNAASAFVEESLKNTHLQEEPHGPRTVQALLG